MYRNQYYHYFIYYHYFTIYSNSITYYYTIIIVNKKFKVERKRCSFMILISRLNLFLIL